MNNRHALRNIVKAYKSISRSAEYRIKGAFSQPCYFDWRTCAKVLFFLAVQTNAWAQPFAAPKLVSAVRLPFTSSASPAVGDINGDGRPEIAVTVDHIGIATHEVDDPSNPNAVRVYTWKGAGLALLPGWPQSTRDATLGLALADLNRNGRSEVLAACGQDYAPSLMEKSRLWITARLYVWEGSGSPLSPWFPSPGAGVIGQAAGHAYAAPSVGDLNNDGSLEIIQSSQGAWEQGTFRRGNLRLWSHDGRLLGQTQSDTANLPWRVYPSFSVETPPVLADLNGDGRTEVIAASFDGRVYAWNSEGWPVPGWMPSTGAVTQTENRVPIRCGISAADLDGDGRDELVAGANDGALYAWDHDGSVLWKWKHPASGVSITSGLAAGDTGSGWLIAAGDSAGTIRAWDANGRLLWSSQTTPGQPVMAEPALGDVNADGVVDVVTVGTDGYVYAFDGSKGTLIWQVPTLWAPTREGMRLEPALGAPALCDLRGNGRLCVIIATASRYVADIPTRDWRGTGHLLVYDCGPGTANARTPWPQYRGGPRRTGQGVETTGTRRPGPAQTLRGSR